MARLQVPEGIGLAQRVGEAKLALSRDHERDLRERQISKDIIKSRARSQPRDIGRGLDRGFDKTRDRNG